MSIEFSYLIDKDVLVVTVSGQHVVSDDTGSLERVLAKLKEHSCRRVLVDYREAEFVVETVPAYNRPQTLEELGAKRSLKMATVYRELTKETRFTENVHRNRGWQMKDFTEYGAAMEWLSEP